MEKLADISAFESIGGMNVADSAFFSIDNASPIDFRLAAIDKALDENLEAQATTTQKYGYSQVLLDEYESLLAERDQLEKQCGKAGIITANAGLLPMKRLPQSDGGSRKEDGAIHREAVISFDDGSDLTCDILFDDGEPKSLKLTGYESEPGSKAGKFQHWLGSLMANKDVYNPYLPKQIFDIFDAVVSGREINIPDDALLQYVSE